MLYASPIEAEQRYNALPGGTTKHGSAVGMLHISHHLAYDTPMRPLPRHIEVMDDAMADVYRRKTPAERLAVMFGMWDRARDMIASILRQEHPDWTDDQIRRETARRLSGGAV